MRQTFDLRKVFGVVLVFESGQNPSAPFEAEMHLDPQGKSGLHTHPNQQEVYEVKEGTLEVYLNNRWHVIKTGQQILIPQGIKHAFRNTGTEKMIAVNKHIPGLRTEKYFETLHHLIGEGKVTAMTGFKNSIHLSLHTVQFADVVKLYRPPDSLIKFGAFIGTVLGYKI